MWKRGRVCVNNIEYSYSAKIDDEPNKYNLNRDRISKLTIVFDIDDVVIYNRGWVLEPTSVIQCEVVKAVCDLYK